MPQAKAELDQKLAGINATKTSSRYDFIMLIKTLETILKKKIYTIEDLKAITTTDANIIKSKI